MLHPGCFEPAPAPENEPSDCGTGIACRVPIKEEKRPPIRKSNAPLCGEHVGDRSHTPVDIIWTVDSSDSMKTELQWVEQNVVTFFKFVRDYHLNARIVLLGGDFIDVPDSINDDNPVFRHITDYVGSHDTLRKIVEWFDRYRDFLRPNAKRMIVVTTDDDSAMSASEFDDAILPLLAAVDGEDSNQGYTFHSIISEGDHFRGCESGAKRGYEYLTLTEQTDGFIFPICDADWSTVFTTLAHHTAGLVRIDCHYPLPEVDPGETIADVIVARADNTGEYVASLPQIETDGQCSQSSAGGWFYVEQPTGLAVHLCPEACSSLETSRIRVSYHCIGQVQ